ncbi:hypothetical protein [Streptomyces nojiriensis]|uniref:hypothetical protein n=1 Tax=Streptomyces nojiriensis TaxID=66374 RepID=UPI00367B8A6D
MRSKGPDASRPDRADLPVLSRALGLDAPALDAVVPALRSWRERQQEGSVVDSWRYRVTWRPSAEATAPRLSGTWPLVIPQGYEEDPLTLLPERALTAHGAAPVRIVVDAAAAERGGVLPDGVQAAGVLSLLALDQRPYGPVPGVSAGLAATAVLVQALAPRPAVPVPPRAERNRSRSRRRVVGIRAGPRPPVSLGSGGSRPTAARRSSSWGTPSQLVSTLWRNFATSWAEG